MAPLGDGLACRTFRDDSSRDGDRTTSAFLPEEDASGGTPLFLIPALGLDGRSYSRLLPATTGRRTVFWNLPNDLPPGGLPALADLALTHAERAGIPGRFVIGGCSLGGIIALQAAVAHPDRIAGLFLIGVAPAWRQVGLIMRSLSLLHPLVPRRSYHKVFATVLLGHPRWRESPDNGALRGQMEHRTKAHAGAVISALSGGGGYDFRPHLASIAVPAVVLHGERDGVVPRRAVAGFEAMPEHRIVHLDQTGHVPQVDSPDRCIPPLRDLLDRVDATERAPE